MYSQGRLDLLLKPRLEQVEEPFTAPEGGAGAEN